MEEAEARWREVALEDVADLTVGHVGPMASEYVACGIPFLRSQNVAPLRILAEDMKFITPEFHSTLKKSALSPGDVVIVRTGKPGAAALIPRSLPVANCSDLVVVRPRAGLDSRFLAYYLNSEATHHVSAHLVGAVQQHFNVASARRLRMRLPPLVEQRAISELLGSLDDKIDLNGQINETLKATARALFKSWFVDFDPVRAKMEGRQLAGMDPEFTALIPDMLDESSLGKIPKGWHVQSVGEVCEFAYGRALKNEDRHVGEVPVFGSNGRIGWNDSALVTGPGIVVGRKGNPGIVTWSSADFWPIDTTFYIVPRGPIRGMHYLFHALKYLDLPGLGADSAVPGLNRNMAYMSKMLVPPPPIVSAFERCVSSLVVQERENELQSATLTTVRDRLLPKLLCGAICLTESNQASTVP